MADKKKTSSKKATTSKKTTKKTSKKKPTAYEKAKKQYEKDKKASDKAKKAWNNAKKKQNSYYSKAVQYQQDATVFHKDKKDYYLKKRDEQLNLYNKKGKDVKAKKAKYDKANAKTKKSKAKYDKLKKYKDNKDSISDKIANQKQGWHNEGTAAIYRTDGHSTNIVFISPGDTESEDTQATVTSYAVDEGSPRSNYARTNSKTVQVGGIITGYNGEDGSNTRAYANKKWKQLRYWLAHHTELTYKGSFTYHHLILSDAQQSFTTMKDNLKVSLTFTFVYAAEITTSTGKKSKTKKSKSSKTTAGTRNKNYKAITIKYGDTLLGLSRKYGKSVAWLQKVNNIKNPNKIYAGRTLYVSEKEKKKAKKARVS